MEEIFAQRLKTVMELRHIKAIQIADGCNISRGLLSQYLSGKRKPKQKQIIKISNYLNVSPEYLLGLDKTKPQPISLTLMKDTHIEDIFYDLVRNESKKNLKKLVTYIRVYLDE